jgi:ABC-type amino acid transport substrate-binding protein
MSLGQGGSTFFLWVACGLMWVLPQGRAANADPDPMISQEVVAIAYPPYAGQKPNGEAYGVEVDILKAALGSKYKLNFHFYPITRSKEAIRHSKINNYPILLGSSLHFKDDIQKGLISSVFVCRAKFVAYVLSENPLLKSKDLSIEKLKSHRVAVLRGSTSIKRLHQDKITPLEVRSLDQLFAVLDQGKVDVAMALEASGDEELRKSASKFKGQIIKIEAPLLEIPLAFSISNEHPRLKEIYERLQTRVAEMRQNGEIKAIAEKYFGSGRVPGDLFRE